jgi:hypothetical protein
MYRITYHEGGSLESKLTEKCALFFPGENILSTSMRIANFNEKILSYWQKNSLIKSAYLHWMSFGELKKIGQKSFQYTLYCNSLQGAL